MGVRQVSPRLGTFQKTQLLFTKKQVITCQMSELVSDYYLFYFLKDKQAMIQLFQKNIHARIQKHVSICLYKRFKKAELARKKNKTTAKLMKRSLEPSTIEVAHSHMCG